MNINKNEMKNELNEEKLELASGGRLIDPDNAYIPIPIPKPPKAPASAGDIRDPKALDPDAQVLPVEAVFP